MCDQGGQEAGVLNGGMIKNNLSGVGATQKSAVAQEKKVWGEGE